MYDQQVEENRRSENYVEDRLNQTIGHGGSRGETKTPLDQAVELSGRLRKFVESLAKASHANERSEGGKTALHRAARDGNEDVVRILIAAGWSVGATDNFGITPLHEAKNERVLKLMLEGRGIRYIDAADNDGSTALHQAAILGDVKMIAVLIDAGARIDAVTNDGETAMHFAVVTGSLKTVETLVKRGADWRICNKAGETAEYLARACHHEDVEEFLQERREETNL
jgi:ankyrin repeat protein